MRNKNHRNHHPADEFNKLSANDLTSVSALVGYAYYMRGDGRTYAEFAAAMVRMYNLDGKKVAMCDLEAAWKASEEFFQ